MAGLFRLILAATLDLRRAWLWLRLDWLLLGDRCSPALMAAAACSEDSCDKCGDGGLFSIVSLAVAVLLDDMRRG